ncbi:hypothetical protein EV426DRAFT_576404 [Tirmania nivea]|nr:hypothetical protein EV426DRAFT_576404 [Tirmania nivea]
MWLFSPGAGSRHQWLQRARPPYRSPEAWPEPAWTGPGGASPGGPSVTNRPGHPSGRRGPGLRAEVRAGLKQPGPAPAGWLPDYSYGPSSPSSPASPSRPVQAKARNSGWSGPDQAIEVD